MTVPAPASRLEPLAELELQVRPDAPVLTPPAEGRGKRLGGGDGVARGARLAGALRWELFERGGVVTGEPRCELELAGELRTDDGAVLPFEARGYGVVPDPAAPASWRIAAVLRFDADDPRYAWLDGLLAPWHGGFDATTGRHRYTVFAPAREAAA